MGDSSSHVLIKHVLIQIVPIVLVLMILAVGFLRHQAARQQQAQGVLWLQAMRMLITHIQRHRGLSSGVLSGDRSLQGKLEEARLQVSRDFEQIGGVGEWVKYHEGWQSITQHWARLAGNLQQLSMSRNMDQHNRLIKNILVFVDEIAVAHHLQTTSNLRANIWRDLLTLAEYIGQVRALGTAFAASGGECDDAVLSRARQDLQSLNQEIVATLEAPRCRLGLDGENLQRILDFLSYVDLHLLREGPQVPATDFYAAATQTLDRLFERFDEELAQVNRRLIR
jgi:hypothetical protein